MVDIFNLVTRHSDQRDLRDLRDSALYICKSQSVRLRSHCGGVSVGQTKTFNYSHLELCQILGFGPTIVHLTDSAMLDISEMKCKERWRPVIAVKPQHKVEVRTCQDRGFISAWLEQDLPSR